MCKKCFNFVAFLKPNRCFMQIKFTITTRLVCIAIALLSLVACQEKPKVSTTPWGTPMGDVPGEDGSDKKTSDAGSFTLADIVGNGELIMLTLSGPETYYDYHGRGMGLQYLLCERFAQGLGVSLRVELCKDTTEMLRRLLSGEGDVVAFPLPPGVSGIDYCGVKAKQKPSAGGDSLQVSWAVQKGNRELADTLNRWFRPEMIAEVQKQETFALSTRAVTRRVFSPMLNRQGGVISHYDHLFQRYASVARWDWRLLAAQCYQESTFDPKAHSWAGACGLMQIMPATAAHLGLSMANIYDPEANIAAAARYISELTRHFSDIPSREEQCYFVLAAYNGGFFHIRDAMALATKHGRNPRRWADVSEFVLKLSTAEYYTDPVVKHGYMRGSETVNYVSGIRQRWAQYRGADRPGSTPSTGSMTPRRANRKHKYKI